MFEKYSVSHIVMLAVFAALILLTSLCYKRPNGRVDRIIRLCGGTCLLALEAVRLIIALAVGAFNVYMLPLHLCAMSMLCTAYLMFDFKIKLFKVVMYWGIIGPLLSLFFPDLTAGITSFRFWHYFIQHMLVFVFTLYLFLKEGVSASALGCLKSITVTVAIMLVLVLPVNLIFDVNFFYLMSRPAGVEFLFSWAKGGSSVVWCLAVIGLFWLTYLLFRLIGHIKQNNIGGQ